MSKIKVLSENISNRIAAGEVIERPASVVKELVENAIDAGALNIKINIEKAGSKLIAVTDDGSGMDADDALLCLEPHATSKIHTEKDIHGVITFGFRGEAIPSVASVSRFTLRTRTEDSLEGNEVVVQGGKFIKAAPVGCAPGTEIIVRDLFFNTPARKKFLKTIPTEEKHIQETVYLLSLPYPNVSFELTMDGHRVFSSPGHDDLMPRIKSYFGKQYSDSMLPLNYSWAGITISGFTARHGFTRNTRREQRTFVNGRAVEALAIFRGIREGYGGIVDKGRFPPCVLFIKMDPFMMDVNVHPAKREVRFRNELDIVRAISGAIRQCLRNAPGPTVTVDPSLNLKSVLQGADISYSLKLESPDFDFAPETTEVAARSETDYYTPAPEARRPQFHTPEIDLNIENQVDTQSETPAAMPSAFSLGSNDLVFPDSGKIEIMGFVDSTYIIASSDSGLLIVDMHAAHERVLYEKILNGCQQESIAAQRLLFPVTIELSRAEAAFISKHSGIFASIGFEIEEFSSNTIMINSIPHGLKQDNISGLIHDILSELAENGSVSGKVDMNVVARSACIAAVKAHDRLTFQEARSLLHQMSACELPFSCPHGRPTIINISLKELEKRFGRK